MKNKKGITLIALVVTIIVLIILAGISINLVLGENRIIKKAQEAKNATEQAQSNEEKALNEIMDQWEILVGESSIITNPEGPVIVEGPVAGGSYDNPYIPVGFTHTEGDGTWNSGYTIKDGLGNEFVWVPCVTDNTKIKNGDNVQIFKKTLPSTTDATDPYHMYNKSNYTIDGDVDPAGDIRTSVGTYGGFYIAKYEAGVPLDEAGNEIAAGSATVTQKARSVSGAMPWTSLRIANAVTVAENMIEASSGVKSGLISGECWDTTLQWMVKSSDNALNEPNVGYDIDTTEKGWYNQSDKTTTGQFAINNIYDMGGNVFEWTTEKIMLYTFRSSLVRGGFFSTNPDYGSINPAADRAYSSDGEYLHIGFRVVLYK